MSAYRPLFVDAEDAIKRDEMGEFLERHYAYLARRIAWETHRAEIQREIAEVRALIRRRR